MSKPTLNEELIENVIQYVALAVADIFEDVGRKFGESSEVMLACSVMGDILKIDVGLQDFSDAQLRLYGKVLGKAMAGDYNIKDGVERKIGNK